MNFVLLILVACLLPLSGRSQTRTWTFAQDGKMVNDSGAAWTFKKNGRIDAAFVRLNGTNAILLTLDATYRTVPLVSLSAPDRSYLRKTGVVSEQEAALMAKAEAAQSAAAKHVIEATRMKNEAAARRRLAQLALDASDRLENEAGDLSKRAGGLAAQANEHAAVADTLQTCTELSPKTNEVTVSAQPGTSIKKSDADNLMQDYLRLKNQASGKRESAARLQREAADLEQAAHLIDAEQTKQTTGSN
jgi:hypothetical protein